MKKNDRDPAFAKNRNRKQEKKKIFSSFENKASKKQNFNKKEN